MVCDFKNIPKSRKTRKMMGHISIGDTIISIPFEVSEKDDEDDILNALLFEFSENSEVYWEEIEE